MAYGLKYFSEFADDQEIGYRVEIHERDYSGDETKVTSSGNPFTLEVTEVDNIFSPIRTKKATIEWVATEDVAFEIKELDLADDQKYKVFLYEIGASETLITKFTGYLVTVDCKEPFGSKPYPIQLSAACGLFFLRDYYFTSDGGEFVLDKINIKNTIGQCLQFANLELDFHTYVDIHDIQMGSGDPLALADFAADGLRGLTCYDALSGVLNAINAFVVQEGDVWVIKGIPDSAALVCPRRIYDYQSAFKSQDLPNQAVSIGREPFNGTIPNLIPTESVTTSLAETSSVVKATIAPGIAVNRLANGQFAYPILGGNLSGWTIADLNNMIYPADGLESKGWTRSGFGTIDNPYRFEMRGLTVAYKDQIAPATNFRSHYIEATNPVYIDAGLFSVSQNKNKKIKFVISGAFKSRGITSLCIEIRLHDGDKDNIEWLDSSGKWHKEKKDRYAFIIDVAGQPEPNVLTPVDELPTQTFSVTSDQIDDFINVGGKAVAKLKFKIFPGAIKTDKGFRDSDLEYDKAPLLCLEDFAVSVTTETIYEGEHTYVADADLPIRNANEVAYTQIVADKINITTPEQVRLSNRVMTGYMSIHGTDNLTYGWNRRIGGQADPIDGIPYPIQYKVLKERIRQVCGKRIVVEGDFLGYDLNASSSVFLQYDDIYDNSKFYTVANWKWDVINRRYSVKLNELSLDKLSSSQEFIELDKEGSGGRGNRLYGNASGGSTSGNGSSSPDIPDPIELDVINPLYFVVGETTTHPFDLGELILSGQTPAELESKFVYYPSWMLYPYEDRGEDGDLLTYTVTGTPTEKGHDQIIIEFTDPYGVDYLAVVPIFIEEPTESLTNIYDTSAGDDLLGSVPGYYFLPDKWDLKTNVLGSHNKVILTVVGGGVSGDEVSFSQTRELEEGTVSSDATYSFFESTNGITTDVGVFKFSVLVYRGNTLISTEYGNFTLYDEEYLAKASNEIYDTSKNELLGVISIDGQNSYKKVDSFDVLTIISDLEHDNIHFTLNKDGVQVFEVDYPSDPSVLEGEYYLFDTVTTEYGAGKYDLIYTVSLEGSDVYQRGASFEFLDAEALPEAGIDLITFKNNTINYSVVDSLPLFNYQADLPDNWGLIIPIPDIDYDYVEWKLYDSTTGGLAEVDIETYTNLPQHISYSGGKTKKDILVFELKNSTDIGDIHRAPSSFRIKAIFKLGGDSGKVTGIRQADFAFRVPLEPEDYSGNRFILVDSTSGSIDVIDSNMPKSGSKYLLPEIGIRWSVSTRSFGGLLFDSVKVRLSKLVSNSYTTLHWLGSDYILQYNSPGDVVELPDDDSAYTDGLVNSDGLRYLYDPSNSEVIIDEIGSYKASFEFFLDGSSIGISETSFDLIDGTEPPVIPIKDCCGGGDVTLPVYEGVEGSYGGDFKTLQVTTTENGTISAIEEIDIVIPGDEIVGLVHNFDVAPKILAVGTDLDSAATYGQVLTALASGSADKSPVKTVATANISLSGLQTINGYTLTNGDRVLVTAQTNATQNGCYVAASGSWVRATDSDTGAELIGASYLVTQGSLLTNQTKWKVVNEPPITIGSTSINIIQIQGAEIDPTVGLWIKNITTTQITNWDAAYTASTNFNSLFDTRLATKTTNNLVEGTVNKYFTEQRVRDTLLTGLSLSNTAITATDSVISAFGKIQGQINTKLSSTDLAGYVQIATANTITAAHVFNNTNLTLPGQSFKQIFSANQVYENYYPVGGNGSSNSYANLRVYTSTGGNKTLFFGGDGVFKWDNIDVVLATRSILAGTGLTGGGDFSSNKTLSVVFGTTAGTVAQGNDSRFTLASTAANRWISTPFVSGDYNNIITAGIHSWVLGATNVPSGTYGSSLTFFGNSPTGDAVSGSWANQIQATTTSDWYVRYGSGSSGSVSWDASYQIITSKQGSYVNWNTAYSWGNHTGLYVPLARTIGINGTAGRITSSAAAQSLSADRVWNIDLATVGTAGTYKSVTTDAYGRVVSGTNPTTLAGYGITDAVSTTTLTGYVRKATADAITADHNFTGTGLSLPGAYYHNTFDGSNIYSHFYLNGGNGAAASYANFRVWNGSGSFKTLRFGGDGTFTWDNNIIATQSWVIANDRFNTNGNETVNYNNFIKGGVRSWASASNAPSGFGTGIAFYGNTTTGNSTSGSWAHQILASTDENWFVRYGSGSSASVAWGSTYQVWTSKQFTSTNITNWNTAYGWGNHAAAGYASSTSLGGYVPVGRYLGIGAGLLGGGNLTQDRSFSVDFGTTSTQVPRGDDSRINNGQTAYSWGAHFNAGYALNSSLANYASIASLSGYVPVGRYLGVGAGLTGGGNLTADRSFSVDFGTSSTQVARGDDSRINNGQTAYSWGAHFNAGYLTGITSPMVTNALTYTPIPNNRTITINGNTQYLNDNPNFTISSSGGTVTGSGTNGYVTRWTGGSSIGNSRIIDNGSGNISFVGAGLNATNMSLDNNLYAGSGSIGGTFSATNLYAISSFTLPTTVESGLSGKGGEGSVAYVNTGAGKGLWVNMGSSGWRLIATRSWVGSSGAGSSPP